MACRVHSFLRWPSSHIWVINHNHVVSRICKQSRIRRRCRWSFANLQLYRGVPNDIFVPWTTVRVRYNWRIRAKTWKLKVDVNWYFYLSLFVEIYRLSIFFPEIIITITISIIFFSQSLGWLLFSFIVIWCLLESHFLRNFSIFFFAIQNYM